MTTSGASNVYNIALNGSFDDCQYLVKQSFNDKNLNQNYNLTAVNSINWFRVLPQSIYYAWSYLNHDIDSFVVPTGNFGNIYSAHILKRMGFPLKELVVATNENNILHRIIKNNDLKVLKVVKTNSPSMDITISSNFERLLSEFLDPSNLDDLYKKMPDNKHSQNLNSKIHTQLSQKFQSMFANSKEVEDQIKKLYINNNILIDPHTAVGVACAEKLDMKNIMCLACAHPVKFQETIKKSLSHDIKYNKNFKFDRDEDFIVLDNSYLLLKEYIQNHA
jgi:threonine synthase